MAQITVWSEYDTPRLRYVLDWLLREQLGFDYLLTQDESVAAGAPYSIFYGKPSGGMSVPAAGLLNATGDFQAVKTSVVEEEGLCMLFYNEDSSYDLPFDLLSAIFLLLSRYEEYQSFPPDRHGRFPAAASCNAACLERPIVDEWVEVLRTFIREEWQISPAKPVFSFQPSYDIDIAWSFRFKGLKRLAGGVLRDLFRGRMGLVADRLKVVSGRAQDPYDSFVWIMSQHMDDEIRPVYFILSAARSSPYDKNIPPGHPQMRALIKALGISGTVALHPSYYSNEQAGLLKSEKEVLESISGSPVDHSRQHFIRLSFPETYRLLSEAGVKEDWSMGYSTCFGFRAGTSQPFYWYDLLKEKVTDLRIHPFAFMDSTAHYDMRLSASDAFLRLREMSDRLLACGGRLVTIMHNYSLGTDPEWRGWRQEYERFLRDIGHNAGGTA